MMTKGEHTNKVHTYAHIYVRDRPYIPSTTLLCEGIIIDKIILFSQQLKKRYLNDQSKITFGYKRA